MFAYLWIFLLGIREAVNIFAVSTTFLTIGITSLQILNVLFLLEKKHWKLNFFHFLLILFFIILCFNKAALPTVNILLSIILLKNIDIKKVLGVVSLCYLIIIFVYFSSYSIGILEDVTKTYTKGITHTLGLKNSNTPGILFLQIVLVIGTYILLKCNNVFILFLFLIPNYYIYELTLSRTSFYSVLLYLFFVIYFSFKKKYKFERKMLILLPLFLFIMTFFFAISRELVPWLYSTGNILLTGRPRMIYTILKSMNKFNYLVGYNVVDMPMDSAYLGILLNGGIFSVLLFFFCNFKGLYKFNGRKETIPFIIIILISGITEGTFSLFRLSTIIYYKILIDQFQIRNLKHNYLTRIEV